MITLAVLLIAVGAAMIAIGGSAFLNPCPSAGNGNDAESNRLVEDFARSLFLTI